MDDYVYDEPSFVEADEGVVSLEGPDGVSVLMTPEAAAETSDRLLIGACAARGQQIEQEKRDKAKR